MECCQTCKRVYPTEETGRHIPCSPYHVRCVGCLWPTAPSVLTKEGLCDTCMATRKNAQRRKAVTA